MPNYLFASNNVAHFSTALINTEAGRFDATRVPYGFSAQLNDEITSPFFEKTSTDVTWVHFRQYHEVTYSNINGEIFAALDDNGNEIVQINKITKGGQAGRLTISDGVSTIDTLINEGYPDNVMVTYDIKIEIIFTNMLVEVYRNNVLIGSLNLQVNQSNITAPSRIRFKNYAQFSGHQFVFSEVIVSDSDTRNARLSFVRPIALGAYNEWAGSVTDLTDDDNTTAMTTRDPEQSVSLDLDTYNGASAISGIVTSSLTTLGQNAPSGIAHLMRLSGVDYEGTVFNPTDGLDSQVQSWDINPATSAPWTAADIAALEYGFRSKA